MVNGLICLSMILCKVNNIIVNNDACQHTKMAGNRIDVIGLVAIVLFLIAQFPECYGCGGCDIEGVDVV